MFTFRPFEATDEDYQAIVAVQNEVWPEFPDTVEKWQHRDKARPPGYFFERLVVEAEGQIVAFGEYGEPFWSHRPGKYFIDLKVLPAYQRRGIATALKARAIDLAKQQGAQKIETGNEENNPMLQINYKLGFKKIDVSAAYEKRLAADKAEAE